MSGSFSSKIFTNANQEIVEYKGEPVYWRVSAYAIIFRDQKVLLIKNKSEKLYDVPGGGVDLGETIHQALERELMEEAGASAKIGKLLHVQEGFFKHANGSFFQTIQLFYQAELTGELVTPTESTSEYVGFVSLNECIKYPLPKGATAAISTIQGEA